MTPAQLECIEYVEKESREDLVGIWELVSILRNAGIDDAPKLKEAVLACVRELLQRGRVAFGDMGPSGKEIRPWTEPDIESTVRRIDREWEDVLMARGRPPTIGDIGYFDSDPH